MRERLLQVDEEEIFFSAAALVVGPPPVNRTSIGFGTLVGSKEAPPAAAKREMWRERDAALKLLLFFKQMYPARDTLDTGWNEISNLYDRYVKWYETEEKLRRAAAAI